jgi:hypothetical protein
MFQFISGVLFGFIMGLTTPYIYRIYKSYRKSGDKSRAIIEQAFLICSSQIFDSIFNTEIKLNELPDLPELVNISSNILSVSNEYNKSFRLVFKKGNLVIKIIDKNIMQDTKFLEILRFFKNNDIELIISSSEEEEEVFKLE